jgi:hypothetical protein
LANISTGTSTLLFPPGARIADRLVIEGLL